MENKDLLNFPKEAFDNLPDFFSKTDAKLAVHLKLKELEEKGRLYSLSDEEVNLLKEYRQKLSEN